MTTFPQELPRDAFAGSGTSVSTVMLSLTKPDAQEQGMLF